MKERKQGKQRKQRKQGKQRKHGKQRKQTKQRKQRKQRKQGKQNKNRNLKQKLGGNNRKSGRAVLKGDSCEYVELAEVINLDGCGTGKKFVIGRKSKSIRRQYLIVEGKSILAFVSNGTKFTSCSTTKNVTSSVTCKTIANLSDFSLSSNSSSSDSNSSSTSNDNSTSSGNSTD